MEISASNAMMELDNFDRDVMLTFLKKMLVIKPESTVRIYQSAIRSFAEYLISNDLMLNKITPAKIIDYIIFLSEKDNMLRGGKLSPGTIRTRIFNLKTFFRWAIKFEYFNRLDFDMARLFDQDDLEKYMPRKEYRLPKPLKIEEINKLLAECPAKRRCLVELMFLTGLRVGEISDIRISNIDIELKEISVIQVKTNQEKLVPVTGNSIDLIKEFIERFRKKPLQGQEDFLFINQFGRKMTADSVRKIIKYLGKKTLSKNITPHQFRSSFATILAAEGASEEQIRELGGWKESETLKKYILYGKNKRRETLERFHPLGRIDAQRKEKDKKQEIIKQVSQQSETMKKMIDQMNELKKDLEETEKQQQ